MGRKNANLIGRYVWLVDLLRKEKELTYQQISRRWEESGLGYGEPLAWRTFQNHRAAIFDIFGISIECRRKGGNLYYIDRPEDLERDHLRSWLISSYSTLHQIQVDRSLEGRIVYENIPSGEQWLSHFTQSMRENRVVKMTYCGFGRAEEPDICIEPYCLKVVRRRWYVIACNRQSVPASPVQTTQDTYKVYALDRIRCMELTEQRFKWNKRFDVHQVFKGCCGIMRSADPIERVVVKSYYHAPDYLRTLPLHESQRELPSEDSTYALFEYHVRPTFDFYLTLLGQADQLEVISPPHIREEMAKLVRHMASYYE